MRNKKIFHLTVFLVLFIFIGITPLFAGDPARTGTAAGVQVLVPVGARDLAMGGANVANTEGLDAIFWNPGGLSSMKGTASGVFSTMNIFNDIKVNYVAVGVKMGRFGTLGISLKSFSFGDIPMTTIQDPDGASGRTFSPTFVTTGLTYSRRLTDAIQVGITGKVVYESVPRASANAFAVDAGIQYHELGGIPGLSFGLVVKNVGTNMSYSGSGLTTQAVEEGKVAQDFYDRISSSDQLPALIELAVGYKRVVAEDNTVLLGALFQNNNFGNDAYKIGAEYMYKDLIALRGGYLFLNNVQSSDVLYRFTLGLGLHVKLGNTDFSLDYSYRDSQYFDGNNLFSIKVGF